MEELALRAFYSNHDGRRDPRHASGAVMYLARGDGPLTLWLSNPMSYRIHLLLFISDIIINNLLEIVISRLLVP